MDFIIRSRSNGVEYTTTRGAYKGTHKGKYIIKHLSIVLTADDPTDLMLLGKFRKPIEKAIIQELNNNLKLYHMSPYLTTIFKPFISF